MLQFGLIGAAGYIAPRHMKAISETGNNLAVALDSNDSIGIMDSYFPNASFYTELEQFDKHAEMLRRRGASLDFISICSPNYLHDAHIRLAMRNQAHAICEKPMVLNPQSLDHLALVEKENNRRLYTILQLRHHPSIVALKKRIDALPDNKVLDIDLLYITSRGRWYDVSWKGDMSKSGGLPANIGIHFFDMLTWIFGDFQESVVHVNNKHIASGFLTLKKGRVRWFLSTDASTLPESLRNEGKRTLRTITIQDEELEFSNGFTDLHTISYEQILQGNGFGIEDARASVETAFAIRNAKPIGVKGEFHPFLLPWRRAI